MTADNYVNQVAFELRDLPWGTRRQLVAELLAHLDELPDGTDLRARLGPPEQYAAELRSAAGLEPHRGPIAFLRARRPRNLILTVVLVAAIGLAIGAVVWIDGYQPLGFGNGTQLPSGAEGAPGIKGESVVVDEGRPFRFGVEVKNYGRYTVRLLGVPYEGPKPWTARLIMSVPNYTGAWTGVLRAYQSFRPFDLKPRQSVLLILDGVYACPGRTARGTSFTYSDFPVRYRFLWRTATADIPLPEDLAFVFRKGCARPARP